MFTIDSAKKTQVSNQSVGPVSSSPQKSSNSTGRRPAAHHTLAQAGLTVKEAVAGRSIEGRIALQIAGHWTASAGTLNWHVAGEGLGAIEYL